MAAPPALPKCRRACQRCLQCTPIPGSCAADCLPLTQGGAAAARYSGTTAASLPCQRMRRCCCWTIPSHAADWSVVTLQAGAWGHDAGRRTGSTVEGVEAVSVSSFHSPKAACDRRRRAGSKAVPLGCAGCTVLQGRKLVAVLLHQPASQAQRQKLIPCAKEGDATGLGAIWQQRGVFFLLLISRIRLQGGDSHFLLPHVIFPHLRLCQDARLLRRRGHRQRRPLRRARRRRGAARRPVVAAAAKVAATGSCRRALC